MTNSKVIKVNVTQKECLEPLFKEKAIAEVGFKEASRLLHYAEERLWDKITELWPTAKRITYSDKGEWTVIIDKE